MKLSRTIILSLLVVAVVVASFGCQAAQRPEPVRYDRAQEGGGVGTGFDNVRTPGIAEDPMVLDGDQRLVNEGRRGLMNGGANNLGLRDNADLMDGGLGRGGAQDDISRRLEQKVEQIAGVRNATVVTEGNTVYVGLDLDQQGAQGIRNGQMNNRQGQTADMSQIKQQVRQVVAEEGQFTNFIISEERAFTRELGGIANEIRTGRTATDFGNALRDLGRTITPAPTRTR